MTMAWALHSTCAQHDTIQCTHSDCCGKAFKYMTFCTLWESTWESEENLSTHIDNDYSWCSVLNTAPLKIDVLYLMGTLQHTIHTDTYEHNLSSRYQAHILQRDITTGHNARMLHIFTLRALLQLRWNRGGLDKSDKGKGWRVHPNIHICHMETALLRIDATKIPSERKTNKERSHLFSSEI